MPPRTTSSPPEECQAMIELGTAAGYVKSLGLGKKKADGMFEDIESESRTSAQAWCVAENRCYKNETAVAILDKLADLTSIPDPNTEYIQLLKYQEGQFYKCHQDYIQHHIDRPMGVRIPTVFLSLNTVEQGGGTRFNDLNITVEAIKGRAVLWPSTMNDDPDAWDERTHHEAQCGTT